MLEICNSFFEYLNSNNIRYCHWKSNTNLEKSLAGKTDLDLLIHKEDKKNFELSLKKFDIKKILSSPEKQFPGMEDYLGFDRKTGRLIHLHIHYTLILGQRFIKNHILPIEETVFSNLTKKNNIYIPCPEMELILLVIRALMKVDIISLFKHGISDIFRKPYTPFPKAIENELLDLISNSNIEKLKSILLQSKLPLPEKIFIEFIAKFSETKLRSYYVLITSQQVLYLLKSFRRQKSIFVYFRYFRQFIFSLPLINNMKISNKKTLPYTAKVFSLIGADGSGKSTLLKDLEIWLSWKLAVKKYYFGIPKTNFCKLLSIAIQVLNKLKLFYLAFLIECYLWVYIANRRYSISLSTKKKTSKGITVITDRFPLPDFHTMSEPMDGPRLNKYTNKTGRYFSHIETNYYSKIQFPDYIFVLQVDIDELRRRKTDLDISTHKIKASAVNSLKGNESMLLIDANKPYSDVLLQIKEKIWEFL